MCYTKFFLIIALLLGGVGRGQDVTKAGTTAAKFLAIGAGSRAVSMGGAFVATADDATAMYWNVGGLARLTRPELLVNYTRWIADIAYTYFGFAYPLGSMGTVGINVVSMTMDEMRVTDYGVEGDYTGETFRAGSYAIGLAYARQITDRFSLGGNVKYIRESIAQCSAGALAVDLGTLFRTPFRGIRLGVSMNNFGQKMQMTGDDLLVLKDIDPTQEGNNESVNAVLETGKFDLPLLMRVGLAKDVVDNDAMRLTLAIDGMHPNDNTEYVNTGLELHIRMLGGGVFLRGGLKSLYMENGEEQFALGAGVAFPVAGGGYLNTDYAVESFVHLNLIHKFSLRLRF